MAGLSFQACKVFSMLDSSELDIESTVFYISSLIRESRISDAFKLLPTISKDTSFNGELLRGKIAHELGNPSIAEMHLAPLVEIDQSGKAIDRLIGVYTEIEKFDELNHLLDLAISRFASDKTQLDYYVAQKLALQIYNSEAEVNLDYLKSSNRYEIIDSALYIANKKNNNTQLSGGTFHTFKIVAPYVMKTGIIAEFGVRNGHSINILSKLFPDRQVFGFDSFEGIPDSWGDEPSGSYTTGGVLPSVEGNVRLIHGWFNKTLPSFAKNHQGNIALLNIDCDIYSSTKDIFESLGPMITTGTIIVFDEYINNKTWRDDEFKAFQEWVSCKKVMYEYISVSFFSKQVAVRILDINNN